MPLTPSKRWMVQQRTGPGRPFARPVVAHAIVVDYGVHNLPTVALAVASLAALVSWNRLARRVAWIGMVLASLFFIYRMSELTRIDTTGLDILQTLHRTLQKRGIGLILCDLNAQPRSLVARSGFAHKLGRENIVEALKRAQHVQGRPPEVSYV